MCICVSTALDECCQNRMKYDLPIENLPYKPLVTIRFFVVVGFRPRPKVEVTQQILFFDADCLYVNQRLTNLNCTLHIAPAEP